MPTPDDHVKELVRMAEHYEKATQHFIRDGEPASGPLTTLYLKRAAALRWILSLNAYGVEEHEVVT